MPEASNRDAELEQRIAIAVAATRDTLDHFEYGLFRETLIADLSLKIKRTPGTTPDAEVNALHYDIEELSGSSLRDLAIAMFYEEKLFERITRPQLTGLLSAAIRESRINPQKMKLRLRDALAEQKLI